MSLFDEIVNSPGCKSLTLIRGLPGSGKSTMAKAVVTDTGALHFEADMYFVKDSEYMFDPTQIRFAHEWCQAQTLKALMEGHHVVVSNTFVKKWEMQAYFAMASAEFANVHVLVATSNYGNVHGVPEEVIERMRANWEA